MTDSENIKEEIKKAEEAIKQRIKKDFDCDVEVKITVSNSE